jgi:biopolymer transport protein ExbD/biopolymer transport protein TolR
MSFNPRDEFGEETLAPSADINVTPLVDVMLVLLIVFMVTAPMLAQGMKVTLPQATAAETLKPERPVVVTVGRDGTVMIGADVVEQAELAARIRGLFAEAERPVHIRADRDADYGQVVAVLDRLVGEGITRLSLLARDR